MSKLIKMTPQCIEECKSDFEKALQSTKMTDGKLTFSKTFSLDNCKATVYFTGEAWVKMIMLIKEFDKEIAWHGVASRVEDESKDEYIISDIVVYPQEVSGASVEMDTAKYAEWIEENIEDERFCNLYMQGHSHVDFGVTPSGVDIGHQESIVNMLGDDDFYIFMIWNKSFRSNTKIYDMKKNILFEDGDVDIKIIGSNEDLDEFLKDAKGKVSERAYSNKTSQSASTPQVNSANKSTDKKAKVRIDAGWNGYDEDIYEYMGYKY